MGILQGTKKVSDVVDSADKLLNSTDEPEQVSKPAVINTGSAPATVIHEGPTHEPDEPVGDSSIPVDTDDGDDTGGGSDAVGLEAEAGTPDEVAPSDSEYTSDGVLSGGASHDPVDALKEFTVGDVSSVTDLSNFAMKVTMKQSRWYGVKRDHKVEAQVQSANQTKVNAGKFTKELLAGCDKELKAVHSAIDAARTTHYALTRPWNVVGAEGGSRRRTGPRLLANADYFDYCQKMAGHKKLIQEALDVFEQEYANLKQKAKDNLGPLYDESEYPAVSSIREQFALDFDFEPLPDGETFKKGSIESQQAEKLASHFNKRTQAMLENALQEVWDKLYRTVEHMVDRLSDPDKTFHKSMLENAQEVAKMLKHYNFTNDPRMDEMRRELEGRLLTTDAKELRKDKDVRKQVAEDAKRTLAKLKSYGLGS